MPALQACRDVNRDCSYRILSNEMCCQKSPMGSPHNKNVRCVDFATPENFQSRTLQEK